MGYTTPSFYFVSTQEKTADEMEKYRFEIKADKGKLSGENEYYLVSGQYEIEGSSIFGEVKLITKENQKTISLKIEGYIKEHRHFFVGVEFISTKEKIYFECKERQVEREEGQ